MSRNGIYPLGPATSMGKMLFYGSLLLDLRAIEMAGSPRSQMTRVTMVASISHGHPWLGCGVAPCQQTSIWKTALFNGQPPLHQPRGPALQGTNQHVLIHLSEFACKHSLHCLSHGFLLVKVAPETNPSTNVKQDILSVEHLQSGWITLW